MTYKQRTKAFHVGSLGGPFMVWTVCAGHLLGRIGGATTFASAKVKNAIGRIGIFILSLNVSYSRITHYIYI